ncbi:predicted protein [Phaeodactylum tricornutum CCAP 1055/1]|uniref:Uncharacterized protein n=2 Tax=Phaeodactylum tricornutum TaxID=2850 RepID=B7G2M8_PHATC|nr:predicted protein [Phaeodactylum tricornutum CCAP 1055/1]EEC47157.1 predicted protein [Phaeodactylum tricornutum CCAP 1055/1]|eukprot:XP_002181234.1 predicted protein [Phaeodactylum tricornutum CCAP 1055/1]
MPQPGVHCSRPHPDPWCNCEKNHETWTSGTAKLRKTVPVKPKKAEAATWGEPRRVRFWADSCSGPLWKRATSARGRRVLVETNGTDADSYQALITPPRYAYTGTLFGASVGSSWGARQALDRARQEEMERLGVTPEMLEAAREIGLTLEQSMDGLRATQESLGTLQRIARRLDAENTELYAKATQAVTDGDDTMARKYLLERTAIEEKLKKTLTECADEKKRFSRMERNVEALEERAREIERLLSRSVGAKAMQNSSELGLALSSEDPLLKKFRDAGLE